MPLLRRVNESQFEDSEDTVWRPVSEGFWRFEIGKADLRPDTKGKLRVRFPLVLTPDEQTRQAEQADDLPEGHMQSTRTYYRPGLSLGFRQQGIYQPTMLIDFLCAALGTENGKKFRKWIEAGGGPARPDDPDDDKAEQELITQWVGWWEGLEVYGTITHSNPDAQGRVWANFAGPMPLGSLPGQPEPDYQALCRGKFRAMVSENFTPPEPEKKQVAPARTATADRPAKRYTADGDEVPF